MPSWQGTRERLPPTFWPVEKCSFCRNFLNTKFCDENFQFSGKFTGKIELFSTHVANLQLSVGKSQLFSSNFCNGVSALVGLR